MDNGQEPDEDPRVTAEALDPLPNVSKSFYKIPLSFNNITSLISEEKNQESKRVYNITYYEVNKLFSAIMAYRQLRANRQHEGVEQISMSEDSHVVPVNNRPAPYSLHRETFVRQQQEQERRRRYMTRRRTAVSGPGPSQAPPPVPQFLPPPVQINLNVELSLEPARYAYHVRQHIVDKSLELLEGFTVYNLCTESDTKDKCTICLSNFAVDEGIRTLHCRHKFHRACVDPWLLRSILCPLCRSKVNDDADESLNRVFVISSLLHSSCSCHCCKCFKKP